MQGYIFWPFPPRGGGGVLSKLKNMEEFEGRHEERKGNGGSKKKKVIKHTSKYLYEA